MKHNIIKIAGLLIAIVSVVGGIIYWRETKVNPPVITDQYNNVHVLDLANRINCISVDSLEKSFQDCIYLLERYTQEGLINPAEKDERLKQLHNVYTPKFINGCNYAFRQQTRWNNEPWKHNFMKERINYLKTLRYADGSFVITDTNTKKEFQQILSIITKYNKATNLAKLTAFVSKEVTQDRIQKSKGYMQDEDLKKCERLMTNLKALPEKIQNSNLRYLVQQTDSLQCTSIEDYDTYYQALRHLYHQEITEYETYYNTTYDTQELKEILERKQYAVLSRFVEYAIDLYNFSNYQNYKAFFDSVYNKLNNNTIGNIETLKTQLGDIKFDYEFNTERFPLYNNQTNY